MKLSATDSGGYTLVESLVAIAVFVTVALGVMNSVGGFIASPRTKMLQAALIAAEDQLVRVSADDLYTGSVITDHFLVQRSVIQRQQYAEITLTISHRDEETKHILTITKFVLMRNEE